jgi:hypothetical protein
VDAGDSKPILSATVSIHDRYYKVIFESSSSSQAHAQTGGEYAIRDVLPGNYEVQFACSDYELAKRGICVEPDTDTILDIEMIRSR